MKKLLAITAFSSLGLIACSTTETSKSIQSPQVTAAVQQIKYNGVKVPVSIGKFDNRSSYMRGIFSDNVDRLGGQAKTILETHLQQTGYFSVLNRVKHKVT